jgi:TnpA family transposase
MASIERTAYPRFKPSLTANELQTLYDPTEEERDFVSTHARGEAQQLTLLTLLKCQQHLGYLPALADVPDDIRTYLCQQFHLLPLMDVHAEAERTLYRYHQLIRTYWDIKPYGEGGQDVVERAVQQATYTMSDPADLINLAIEHLIQQRFELPAFSTLDRLVTHVRHGVHQDLYARITALLDASTMARLDALLHVRDGRTEVNRIKETPRQATLQHLQQWTQRLTWLESILATRPFLTEIAHTKIQPFAAEASALEVGDMRDIHTPSRRYSLLICFLYHAQVQTRDQLVEMLLKRMRRTTTSAKQHLKELQDQYRELEEQMLAVFADVLDQTLHTPDDNATLGQGVRDILAQYGGAEVLRERYEHVSAYHHQNYRPLMWGFYRPYRAELFRLSHVLTFRSATQHQSLIEALHCIQRFQHTRRDYLPDAISLDFASVRWQALIRTRHQREPVLNRVANLRERLRETAQRVDATYPENTELTIDDEGTPHLKRLQARPIPEDLHTIEAVLKDRMPERHLLDMLKDVQHWVGYTRHFGPPAGAAPKLSDPVLRYIFTVFGYACELGASQTARHANGPISRQVLRRINEQHITASKLEASLRDVIVEYTRFELPFLWGSGKAAIADGTHVELIANNLLGAHHVRYGKFGGIAYHHISDTYIALFSHFMACGVWEAVYILDGLLKHRSALQPDTLHADTHGQAEPVFGLAALLGIQLLPRMRTWNDVTLYRVDRETTYKHIDALFTQVVDWELIERHWHDMMQVVLSIQAGKVLPSMLLQKLGVYSRQSTLYRAFSELGRVERTRFLRSSCSRRRKRVNGNSVL